MFKKLVFTAFSLFAMAWAFAAVNINTADKEELTSLKGIGEAKATAILEYRKENGPFKSKEDIKKVKGIGDGIFAKIEKEIEVGKGSAKKESTKKADKKAEKVEKADKKAEKTKKEAKKSAKKEAKKTDKKAEK